LALLGARIGWMRLDGYAAMGVSLFIAWTGFRYARNAVNTLDRRGAGGGRPGARAHDRRRGPGVRGVHDVIVHSYGDVRLISFHIEVDAHLTLLAAHDPGRARRAEGGGRLLRAHDRARGPGGPQPSGLRAGGGAADRTAGGPRRTARLSRSAPERAGRALRPFRDFVARTEVPVAAFGGILETLHRQLHERLPAARRIDLGLETEFASENELRRVFRRDEMA